MASNNAILNFGTKKSFIGSNARIMCFEYISLGDTCEITWDCQIMDTSFHYIEDMSNNVIKPLTKPVTIGNNVWVGNRTTISKGSVLPDFTIVASSSLVNKDFSDIGENCLIAGMHAKLKHNNIRRVYDYKKQRELDKKLNYSRTYWNCQLI